MNNKILSAVLVLWIASTWFASFSSADETTISISEKFEKRMASVELTDEQKADMLAAKDLIIKKKSGTDLTEAEQAQLDELKKTLPKKEGRKGNKKGWDKKGGKKGMKNHLTDEEKVLVESMSDDEKKAFFETKKAEHTANKEARKTVMDKLLAGIALTAEEETLRVEIATKMNDTTSESKKKGRKGNGETKEIMKKLVNGETITAEEKATLEEMKAKHEERKIKKEEKKAEREAKKAAKNEQ